jgi:hypothetical protein
MWRKKSRLKSFFSLTRHRRRWGAGKYSFLSDDLEPLKLRLIEPHDDAAKVRPTAPIDVHVANLRAEFAGKPELLYEHAKLISLIRREFKVAENYAFFHRLWERECTFLCENLNLRWLVSAADTFADHDPDLAVRLVGMLASTVGNVVKIYETDRFIFAGASRNPVPARMNELEQKRRDLFDGMLLFRVGSDDTLRNMRRRLEPFFAYGPVGELARTVYDRMQVHDTAFARLRSLHRRDRTSWW